MRCGQCSQLFNAKARYVYSNRGALYILCPESVPEGILFQCTCQLQELDWINLERASLCIRLWAFR